MIYQCLIVDDERLALKLLAAYIEKLPHLQLSTSCENGVEAITALKEHVIDLLFLDIQMPDLTGLELLKTLKTKPQVILTTAYREYAVEGFALEVTDYLVKPFSFERFAQAVNKATDNIESQNKLLLSEQSKLIDSTSIANQFQEEHFYVKTNHKLEKVSIAEICFVESMREYVSIQTTSRRFVVHQTMNAMDIKLSSPHFMRIHRSFIVNLNRINSINGNQVQIGEKKVPIGGNYRKAFFEKIDLF